MTNTNTDGFPRYLLDKPPKERTDYFAGQIVLHRLLREAGEEVYTRLTSAPEPFMLFVFGPTGFGKTTLLRLLNERLVKHLASHPTDNPGQLAGLYVEVPAPDDVKFSWRTIYRRILGAAKEPLLWERKSLCADSQDPTETYRVTRPTGWIVRYGDAAEIRELVEKCFRNRRPLVMSFDEAQHFKKTSPGRDLDDQAECIKSLASLGQTNYVLCGPYSILELRQRSGQVIRRSPFIHLRRYNSRLAQDRVEYVKIARYFARHLPLPVEPDLKTEVELLFTHTLGCVGLLKNWLLNALRKAMPESDPKAPAATQDPRNWRLTPEILRATAPTLGDVQVWMSEIIAGEKEVARLVGDENDLLRIRQWLGFKPQSNEATDESTAKKPERRKQLPGTPKPRRDPIGPPGGSTAEAA